MKKMLSMRRRLLIIVVVLWMLTVTLIYAFMSISYRNDIINKTKVLMEESLKNFTYFNAQRIDEAIQISKKTSYEQIIENAWRQYCGGSMTKSELYRQINGNLTSKFYNDSRFEEAIFYLTTEPDTIYYTRQKKSDYVDIFQSDVADVAHNISDRDTSDAYIRVIKGRIFIIRNLYTITNYTKFGTLVLELNKDKLTNGITFNKKYQLEFYINDTNSLVTNNDQVFDTDQKNILSKLTSLYSTKVNRKVFQEEVKPYTGMIYQQKFDDFHFGALLIANEKDIYTELDNLYLVMLAIILIIIPVFIYMIYFISHHISKPMSRMIDAAKILEQGNIGKRIEGKPMPNKEFDVLVEAFNKMSSEIKSLFDDVYSEKLARKDAKIIALQSQINPHFLNNTLEMMNWQARMAGDATVSKMIEALGTLMNSSMDRSNKKMINLAEELRCVDAYCYIISMRFGKRLLIEKDIDESLMHLQVPQLILQPLIENSVVHGVETVKSGTIQIKIYKDGTNAVLQIINTGKNMTQEDIDRVESILHGTYEQSSEERAAHESMGIHNVNERIKLIYGEEYGLTIKPVAKGETASTIIIPLGNET